ncbi:MAG: hypothetical protein IIA27_14760 [Gemmatimonadetes bacterium]|nr:hypothetical protein [Gemmatimonadota bacterium]
MDTYWIMDPDAVVVETPGVRNAHDHTITWRVRPRAGGMHTLKWRIGDRVIEKRLAVDDGSSRFQAVSVMRPGSSLWDRLLHPAEPALDEAAGVRRDPSEHQDREAPYAQRDRAGSRITQEGGAPAGGSA